MIQIFDVDRSLSSIGDQEEITRIFGLDPIPLDHNYSRIIKNKKGDTIKVTGMDQHLKEYLGRIFQKKQVKKKNELFGVETTEIETLLTDSAKKLNLKGIVVDSISGLGEGVRESLIRSARFDQMTMDLWGKYGVRIGNLLVTLRDLPLQVFLTCHIDRVENDQGIQIEYPAIKGGQKTDGLRWFDVIVYNTVNDGRVMWQVTKDDQRPFIRSRMNVPEWEDQDYVEPDYLPVLRAYKSAVTPLKMLVCGDSGTGKTYALQTMEKYVQAQSKSTEGTPQSRKNNKTPAEEQSG